MRIDGGHIPGRIAPVGRGPAPYDLRSAAGIVYAQTNGGKPQSKHDAELISHATADCLFFHLGQKFAGTNSNSTDGRAGLLADREIRICSARIA